MSEKSPAFLDLLAYGQFDQRTLRRAVEYTIGWYLLIPFFVHEWTDIELVVPFLQINLYKEPYFPLAAVFFFYLNIMEAQIAALELKRRRAL